MYKFFNDLEKKRKTDPLLWMNCWLFLQYHVIWLQQLYVLFLNTKESKHNVLDRIKTIRQKDGSEGLFFVLKKIKDKQLDINDTKNDLLYLIQFIEEGVHKATVAVASSSFHVLPIFLNSADFHMCLFFSSSVFLTVAIHDLFYS